MRDLDTKAIRAELADPNMSASTAFRRLEQVVDALDEARTFRRGLRSRLRTALAVAGRRWDALESIRALPRFPDDDDPTVQYVLASDLDAVLRGDR